ncbi:hypothetical protein SAMN05443428_13913 [Caloramator quimbayensis]|uniref:Uncharacterized protein n=1 Tax=Caloramator quimbayensis TaxID=1147123 RepID=A0A1T4YEF6_9CLOT|nr:hypothetical protein [Caloramator quimbayensis]SKA99928.1 hypothetical protein SAMN05443428_13913 [Caloramator quimbayensis]
MKNYDLILSNDIDSLYSCILVEQVKGYRINYFYDFRSLYQSEQTGNDYIGVDIDLMEGYCLSNHVTRLSEQDKYNPDAFNLNNTITNDNYIQKYSGSTALYLYKLFKLPLPKTEEGKLILLAIDAGYKGYYIPNFRNIFKHNLVDVLGFEELYFLCQKYTLEDFINIIIKYNLNGKIWFNNGGLQTNIKLKELQEVLGLPFFMPKNKFTKIKEFEYISKPITNETTKDELDSNIFSLALTRKNYVNYSKLKLEG